ncbi:class I SAM-dependent methyltransferase [Agromyces larvae]|uniref:Methyltransferase n=1 Tax=Agromyces larvae TaxID=2929802 RepID=A0ABY4BVK9_9MICO|nr:class I SAM-dependent methyltransferase [Agromyces larvae]UOE43250.1 methyltransferase [Agromyces larvae]
MELSDLRRRPDVSAPGLEASDAADRLILDEARPFVDALVAEVGSDAAGAALVTIGDTHGALTLGVAAANGLRGIRAHQDALLGERAILENARRLGYAEAVRMLPAEAELVEGARVVLLRLPRSLDALDEVGALIAEHAADDVVVIAGGRLKHMSPAMNHVLLRHFGRVDVSHARQKSRVLVVREPHPSGIGGSAGPDAAWPRRAHDDELGIEIVSHGGAFAGTSVDIGTRFLIGELPVAIGGELPERAIDLACGTGVVAVALARLLPAAQIEAYDQSAVAVDSARATAAANGVAERILVERADGLELVGDGDADLVVLNPPFHSGGALTTALAERLFADAGRALRPGGRLVAVWNSHLKYRPALQRLVGPTRQIARNPKFTVTVSTRP